MPDLSENIEEKVAKLSMIEQQMTSFLSQKQTFQTQLVEIESALEELEKAPQAYKIIGTIMVSAQKEDLKKELLTKKETAELRIASVEKQEEKLRQKAQEIQTEVLAHMQKKA